MLITIHNRANLETTTDLSITSAPKETVIQERAARSHRPLWEALHTIIEAAALPRTDCDWDGYQARFIR